MQCCSRDNHQHPAFPVHYGILRNPGQVLLRIFMLPVARAISLTKHSIPAIHTGLGGKALHQGIWGNNAINRHSEKPFQGKRFEIMHTNRKAMLEP